MLALSQKHSYVSAPPYIHTYGTKYFLAIRFSLLKS